MDEHVLAAVVGLNEAVALLPVEPLHSTNCHCRKLLLKTISGYERSRERWQAHCLLVPLVRTSGRDPNLGTPLMASELPRIPSLMEGDSHA
jgi:hypothetical protein